MNTLFNLNGDPYPGKVIKEGDTGNNVAKIQVWLNYLSNVYSPLFSLKIDGIFGTTTKNDVVMFQKMFSLKPDGIVGEKTWKLLSCVYNNILGGKSYPIKPTYIGYGLAVGAVDDYVKILQYMLVTASFKYPQIEAGGKIKVDGIFGEITKKAVIAFQKIAGIKPDGVAGKETFNTLYPIYKDIICANDPNCNKGTKKSDSLNEKSYSQYKPLEKPVFTSVKKEEKVEKSVDILKTNENEILNEEKILIKEKEENFMKNEIFTEKSQPVQVAASCIVPYPGIVYRNGSSGPNVVLIQNWLNGIAGTYPAIKTITVDGKFGNNTQTQVEVFQTMWGLTIDGAVGTNTWTKLNSVYCNVLAGQINPITPKYIGYPLYPGSTGSYVKTIQYMLNVCHSYYTQIPLLVIDGNWGNQTTLAVKTFQGIVGLKQDGVVGRETWGSLVYVYTEIMNGQIPTPIDPDAYPGYPTKIGDVNSNVAKIQSWLNIVAQYYSPVKTLVVDSYFGPATEAEVMAFQSMFGLKEDGIVGEITWDTLVGIKTSLEEQVIVPITPKYIGYPVSQGATGNYVRNIQYMLNTVKAVYPSIPLLTVDGIYGSITAAAVREYQRLSSLTVDGVVGQITFNSLLSKYTEVIRGVVPPTDQYPGFPIKLGDNNQYVNTIQTWLAGIAPHYTPIKNTTVDNYFGIGTFNDVTAFQNMFSLAETGIVEETTWNGLKFVYNSYMGGNITPISPTYPGAPLRVGSSGNSVKSTQYMLNVIALTYTQIVTLKVDGAYGVKTRNSVITFQNLFGLTPDGVVGLNTWNKIIAVYTGLIS